jgi:aminodeoxychorismate lyase
VIVYLNGAFVPAELAVVPVFDRGFLYGDGVFETIRVYQSRPLFWAAHMERLRRGLEALQINVRTRDDELRSAACELLRRNGLVDAILRLTVTRGAGKRGYLFQSGQRPTVVMATYAATSFARVAPKPWRLHTSSIPIAPGHAWSGFKTANKLAQVMALAEAQAAGADEALMINCHGHVAEAAAANVFWYDGDSPCTPALAAGGLPGTTRAVVLKLMESLGFPCAEVTRTRAELQDARGMFLTLSTQGIVVVSALDGQAIDPESRTVKLREAYWEVVARQLSD